MQDIIQKKFWRKGGNGRKGLVYSVVPNPPCTDCSADGPPPEKAWKLGLHVFLRIPTTPGVTSNLRWCLGDFT